MNSNAHRGRGGGACCLKAGCLKTSHPAGRELHPTLGECNVYLAHSWRTIHSLNVRLIGRSAKDTPHPSVHFFFNFMQFSSKTGQINRLAPFAVGAAVWKILGLPLGPAAMCGLYTLDQNSHATKHSSVSGFPFGSDDWQSDRAIYDLLYLPIGWGPVRHWIDLQRETCVAVIAILLFEFFKKMCGWFLFLN